MILKFWFYLFVSFFLLTAICLLKKKKLDTGQCQCSRVSAAMLYPAQDWAGWRYPWCKGKALLRKALFGPAPANLQAAEILPCPKPLPNPPCCVPHHPPLPLCCPLQSVAALVCIKASTGTGRTVQAFPPASKSMLLLTANLQQRMPAQQLVHWQKKRLRLCCLTTQNVLERPLF